MKSVMVRPNLKAQTILNRINYSTLATVSESGEPWNSPVYCAYDAGFKICPNT